MLKHGKQDDWPMYSGKAEDYEMGEPIGESLSPGIPRS